MTDDDNGSPDSDGIMSETPLYNDALPSDAISGSSIDIGEITEEPDRESVSTAALLHSCKRKILVPYLRLMAVMGLRPLTLYSPEPGSCLGFLNSVYLVLVLIIIVSGYLLQYMACFRRDRGFYYRMEPLLLFKDETERQRVCYGNIVFSYIMPSVLHFSAYVYALFVFRVKESEQLQNLMERVFLQSCQPCSVSVSQKWLVRTLWISVGIGLLWMALSLVSVSMMMAQGAIVFQWIDGSPAILKMAMKVLLVFSTMWHDMVQATIITSYCLQGQLLISHLHFLRDKLMQHLIQPLVWMKEIGEFRKLLKYYNKDLGPIVCILTILNIVWAASGIVWLMKYDIVDHETMPIEGISILNVSLWVLLAIVPFIQAARLTTICGSMRTIGHEVRVRPFGYQDTPGEDLDTILLYAASLRMTAKLFFVPVTGKYLCFALTVGVIVLLTLGQCHLLY